MRNRHNEIIKNNKNDILVDSNVKLFYLNIIKILNNKKFKKIVRNASKIMEIFLCKILIQI